LDKHWPVSRQKKSARVQERKALSTKRELELFHSRWFKIHRHVFDLIATPTAEFSHRELKLMHQLMELSRRVRTFELILTARKLMTLTALDDEYLPKTRELLQRRGLLQAKREGTLEWSYTLLDPKTQQPFDELTERGPIVIAGPSWNDVEASS